MPAFFSFQKLVLYLIMNSIFPSFKSILLSLLVFVGVPIFAQTKSTGKSALPLQINLSDSILIDYNPELLQIDKQPIPSAEYGNKKEQLYQKRMQNNAAATTPQKKSAGRAAAVNPTVQKAWIGNNANGAPSDNDIAVSDSGKVVSVVNTNFQVYSDSGLLLLNRSLSVFAGQLGFLSQMSDPRVLYDPATDRFVFTCFAGNSSAASTIIVGFSKTNKPEGQWNFYKLNGNSFNDSTWSDYPIIALSGSDLFITFNQVRDNVSWTVGFKQSVIWQIDKAKGYAGDSLEYTLWSDLKLNNTPYRNICPAKYQSQTMDDNMYFLSVRNVDFSNDSIFLLEITNSHRSGSAQLTQRILKAPVKYGFPPNALQAKIGGKTQQLMTNDGRVVAAIYENDYIHFGANSINPAYTNAAVYLGTISNVSAASPTVSTQLFSTNTTEYGYPSMTYLGTFAADHKVLYTFSHCFTDSFPGTSILYRDANGQYSDIIEVKNGTSVINNFSDSIERWGDYTNIQRIYKEPNTAFLSGSWGDINKMRTWIAKVEVSDPTTGLSDMNKKASQVSIFPNPVYAQKFTTRFELTTKQIVRFELYDLQGKLVTRLLETNVSQGQSEFSFETGPLPKGIYQLVGRGEAAVLFTKSVVVE